MPLALVAMGQTSALLVGGFDVSVAALMTICVVTASFTMTPETSTLGLIPGALALVGVGLATGVFNAILIRVLRLPSIIATLGTLSILEGVSLLLRDHPSHGYELVESLEGLIPGGRVDLGNLYRTLRALEARGVVSSEWDAEAAGPAKRRYELTDAGRERLGEWAASLERMREDELKEAAIVFASFAYHAAMRDAPIPRASAR